MNGNRKKGLVTYPSRTRMFGIQISQGSTENRNIRSVPQKTSLDVTGYPPLPVVRRKRHMLQPHRSTTEERERRAKPNASLLTKGFAAPKCRHRHPVIVRARFLYAGTWLPVARFGLDVPNSERGVIATIRLFSMASAAVIASKLT